MGKFFAFLLLFSMTAFGAGSVTVTKTKKTFGRTGNMEVVQIDWTADAADGSVPNTNITMSGFVQKIVTNPGATAPTANYDMALGDPEDTALDALAGALANRHTTSTEQVYPTVAGTPGTVSSRTVFLPPGTYQFQLTNNAVNSATGRVLVFLADVP